MRLAVALAVWCALLPAGSGPPPSPTQPDAQSSYETRTEPGAGQRFLERFVGDWDVVKTFHPQSGEPVASNGTCRQRMIHGGRFLQSDFVFQGSKGETTGLGLSGFDPETGRFTTVWTDSRSDRMSLRQSREPFDGKRIVLYGAGLGEKAPARQSRTETVLSDGGRRIEHRQFTVGADGRERLIMELSMTRRSEAAKSSTPRSGAPRQRARIASRTFGIKSPRKWAMAQATTSRRRR
jgi:hypothetical protein